MQGSAEKRPQVPTARRLLEGCREGSRWPRGPPPSARGGCSPHSFSPRGWANTATCLRPRHRERKSSLPKAAVAGKTRAGVRPAPRALLPAAKADARTQSRCSFISFLAWPASRLQNPPSSADSRN